MDGVILTPLKCITQIKGNIFHVMKRSSLGYSEFGEAYFSTIYHDEIKGWKKHKKMVLNIIVPVGEIQFVIFDDREESVTKGEFAEVNLSLDNYHRLTINPGLWVGFKGKGKGENMLLNIASIEHDPAESENIELQQINFNWS